MFFLRCFERPYNKAQQSEAERSKRHGKARLKSKQHGKASRQAARRSTRHGRGKRQVKAARQGSKVTQQDKTSTQSTTARQECKENTQQGNNKYNMAWQPPLIHKCGPEYLHDADTLVAICQMAVLPVSNSSRSIDLPRAASRP